MPSHSIAIAGLKVPIVVAVFLFSLCTRLLLFYTVYDGERHGSAYAYGSTAIGLFCGDGLTLHSSEVMAIEGLPDTHSGDFLTYHMKDNRTLLTEFLPGPAVLLALLWTTIPIYNFVPYILSQCVLDAILITLFYVSFLQYDKHIAGLTTIFMIVNLAAAKRTLMVGYDFWPQFAVLVTFLGGLRVLEYPEKGTVYFFTGLLTSVTFWFRDITTFLPLALAPPMLVYLKRFTSIPTRRIATCLCLYIVPVLVSLALLSLFRYQTTGSLRPTRSTFWHSFMAGVGQFSNPYNIESSDTSVWQFGKRVNDELAKSSLDEMYKLPDSPYELTLRGVAQEFVTKHPYLFLRNTAYRIAIMISPLCYKDGDFIPRSVGGILFPIGILLFPIWIIGMIHLRSSHAHVFWLTSLIYAYFFVAFGWFYVVGRVILPYLFMSIFVYMFGIRRIIGYFAKKRESM